MITLINGFPQGPNGLIVPLGSIKMQLNVDATVIAPPGGFVAADIPVVFQFDKNGALIQPAKIWSNEELDPQNAEGLGTYYFVTFYDQNGAILNNTPLWWIFPNTIGATVDISQMVAISTVGGNVLFYPRSIGGAGTVTSVAFVGNGVVDSATPSTPVTTSGNITATILNQSANLVLAGPATGSAAAPTFRSLVTADLPAISLSWDSLLSANGNLTLANTTFNTTFNQTNAATWTWANITAATGGANQSSPNLKLGSTYWNGSASAIDTWTIQNVLGSGTNPTVTLTFSHSGSSGALQVSVPALTAAGNLNGNLITSASSITASADVIALQTAPATNIANQNSGKLTDIAKYWDGAASQSDTWTIQAVLGTGTNPMTRLTFAHTGTPGVASVAAPSLTVTGATITGVSGEVSFGTTQGFGTGSAGTAVTTTTKGGGTGPTTAEVVVNYLEIDIAGTKFFIPLVQ